MSKQSSSERSKYLAYLLRHKPETANLSLDKEGWCDFVELLKNTDFTLDELEQIVKDDKKQRYAIKYWEMDIAGQYTKEPTHIRANQGHSTDDVNLTFKASIPPVMLFHGTTEDAWVKIKKQGLLPMNRHHVHLSADIATAQAVGARRKGNVLLSIDAKSMLADGITFYKSENNVWLVKAVPAEYIERDK